MFRDVGEPGAAHRTRRTGPAFVVAALLVVVTVGATLAGTLSLSGTQGPAAPAGSGEPPAPAAPDPPTPLPTTGTAAAPPTPAAVIRDPALRTLAEPFLAGPGASCEQRDPGSGATEAVACDLGAGRAAVFTRWAGVEVMRERRGEILTGERAAPGSVRSLRWRYVTGGSGTHTGIPAGRADRGEGTRVRYVDLEGAPRLYFDQDSCGCTGELTLTEPTGNDTADLERLRDFWADPAA